MNDLISRQAAIDANCVDWCNRKHSECPYFDNVGTNEQVCDGCYTVLVLKDLPPAQPEPKWTPCEKALPKENGFYEVTVGSPYKPVRIYEYKPCNLYENKNRWKAGDGCYVFNWFVEAWRECPKPYERSEDVGKSDTDINR